MQLTTIKKYTQASEQIQDSFEKKMRANQTEFNGKNDRTSY